MPAYLNGPFNPPVTTLERGKPGYSFGSFNDLSAPSVMQITAAAQSANVATLTVTLLSGDPPAAGTGVYVQGSLAGEGSPPYGYNGGPYTLSTVNFTSGSPPITGVHGIITFPFTTSHNSGTLPDVGLAVVPTPVLAEVVTTNEVGKQFGLPQSSLGRSGGDSISWSYHFPNTTPATATTYLQGADIDVDSQYSTLDSGTSTTGETRPPLSTSGVTGVNYLRIKTVFTTVNGSDVINLIARITA